MFKNYYNGKRVFVTGHTGFKGTWLCFWLNKLGAKVCGYSNGLVTEPSNFFETKLENSMTSIMGDINDYKALEDAMVSFKPDLVFHLAAEAIVRTCYDDPKLAFDTNLGGTVNVLNILKSMPDVESAIIITSDKCYENVEWIYGYRETDHLGGKDPYSASKACAEIAFSAYARSYFNKKGTTKVVSVRAGNVIGGGDWAKNRIVPDCFKSWAINQKVELRNPDSTRPWQHVLEPLSGYMWLAAQLAIEDYGDLRSESFNFGPRDTESYSVADLINEFKKYCKNAHYFVNKPNDEIKKEASLLKLCCDKSLDILKWNAVMKFENTVKFTADWYNTYFDSKANLAELMISQITEYEELASSRGIVWTIK